MLKKQIVKKLLLSALCILATCFYSFAQKNLIKGFVKDSLDRKPLHYAVVSLVNNADSLLFTSVRTNESGYYEINKIPPANYTIVISYPKMADYLATINVPTDTSKIKYDTIRLITQAMLLKEVIIQSGAAIKMKGDTLQYTADSFKVTAGSNVEELLKRLPGVLVEMNGKIMAQGKEVKKILVDGDEFFSEDPKIAAKYLKADAVDKVQVYDGKSEKALITGIDDGERTKTINLKLKLNKQTGYFGKIGGGKGENDLYAAEAMIAKFKKSMKASAFGFSNRVGKAGFDYQELSKYVNRDYERIDDGNGSYYYTSSGGDYEGSNYYGSGIPEIQSGGLHYSNKWNDNKNKLFANYRINHTVAAGDEWNKSLRRADINNFVRDSSVRTTSNSSFSQKASGSFDFQIDTFTSVRVSIDGRVGERSSINNSFGQTINNGNGNLKNINNNTTANTANGRNFNSTATFRRRFKKDLQNLTLTLQQGYDKNNGVAIINNTINYYNDSTNNLLKYIDTAYLKQTSIDVVNNYAAQATFSSVISKVINYSLEAGYMTRKVDNLYETFDNKNKAINKRVDSLSNDYFFNTNSFIAGLNATWNITKAFSFNAGNKWVKTDILQTNNTTDLTTIRNFVNIAPRVGLNYRSKDYRKNIGLSYNLRSNQPNINQLQPFIRTSNKLYVQKGNPNLDAYYNHNLNFNVNYYNWEKGTYLYGNASATVTENAIVSDRMIDKDFNTVSSYFNYTTKPQYYGYLDFNWRYKKINLEPRVGLSYNNWINTEKVNGYMIENATQSLGINNGLRYTFKEKFSINYSGGYNFGKNTGDTSKISYNTFSHRQGIDLTWHIIKNLQLKTDFNADFQAKSQAFSKSINYYNWNATLTKKIFKNGDGEISLKALNILQANNGYNRSINGSNVYESYRSILGRYFLLSFYYNFSKQ